MLEKEYAYFSANRDGLVKEHAHEYVVIKGEEIKGFFPSENAALEAMRNHELGTFLIQHCVPEEQEIRRYHSRAEFS